MREKNGVACSTRNQNLNANQFNIASKVYHFFKIHKTYIINKKTNFNKKKFEKSILSIGVSSVDYIEVYNPKFLKKPKNFKEDFKIFFAYYLGKIRLIDNI